MRYRRKLIALPTVAAICVLIPLSGTWYTRADARGDDCQRARDRALLSLRRAQRSLGRSRIALLRVQEELRRAGQESLLPALSEVRDATPLNDSAKEMSLEEIGRRTWVFRQKTERVGTLVVAEMDRRRPRGQPESLHGPDIRKEEETELTPTGKEKDPCAAWALYAEEAAFRAEQSAQLAEVAADQAIALANYEVANRAR